MSNTKLSIDTQLSKYCDNSKVLVEFFWDYIWEDIDIDDEDTYEIDALKYAEYFIEKFAYYYKEEFDIDCEDLVTYANDTFKLLTLEKDGDWILKCYIKDKAYELFKEEYWEDTEYIWNKIGEEALLDIKLTLKAQSVAFDIAIKKLLRSKIYNTGLGLKISTRDAMNDLDNIIM